jgi:predicted Zn finger-like uncharacterized protein
VIVSCPNCKAQYRVAVGVVMRRPRMKCAACSHRWVPAEEIDEDEAVAAVQEEARAASLPPPPPPEPEPEPESEPEPPPPRRPPALWLKWLVAIVLGAAFATASVGLWVGRIDPEALPGVTDAMARVAPPATPLDVKLEGRVTRLPGGGALLEVTGTIHNPGATRVPVPPLDARLLVNGVRARDWTIPPPAASVGPGKTLIFASSLTDVPAGPVSVQVRFGR